MIQAVYEEWLTDLKHIMKKENGNILLLIGNATSHCGMKAMRNVLVKFLPPNLISEV
jgi:hypothetical protein